jgi:hypothetical protein
MMMIIIIIIIIKHCNNNFNGKYWTLFGTKLSEPSCDQYYLCPDYRGNIAFLLPVAQQPYSDLGHITVHISRYKVSHTHTHTVGLLWTRDRTVAETATYTTHNIHKRQTSMSSAGYETIIPASDRPQTYVLDRAATGVGDRCITFRYYVWVSHTLNSNYFSTQHLPIFRVRSVRWWPNYKTFRQIQHLRRSRTYQCILWNRPVHIKWFKSSSKHRRHIYWHSRCN